MDRLSCLECSTSRVCEHGTGTVLPARLSARRQPQIHIFASGHLRGRPFSSKCSYFCPIQRRVRHSGSQLQAVGQGEDALYSKTAAKALEVNLNPLWYGVLAEIGAGQEVARWFFRVGAAAGTIAKSVSAYDMLISDTTYGAADRYVTRERLQAMLDAEYLQVNLTLRKARGASTAFFAFADTVVAKAFNRQNECHGWLGLKFQSKPRQDVPNQVLIHIRMLDSTAQLQQEAVGALGVNLIHAALTCGGDTDAVIGALLDDLSRSQIEVDLIDFSGPDFKGVDNRVMALRLVQNGLCDAALFDPSGKLLIPQEQLYKKNVLLVRGRFRPFTLLHNDMLMGAATQFFCSPEEEEAAADSYSERSAQAYDCVYRDDSCVILELTTRSMMEGGDLLDWTSNSGIQEGAFIQTIEALSTMGYIVMLSNYSRYFRLASYISTYTHRSIVIAMGVPALKELFKEKFYTDLQGGILEGFGRMLKFDLKIYVYPTLNNGELVTADKLKVDNSVQKLYDWILERGAIIPIREYDANLLRTGDVSRYVQESIRSGTDEWENLVPALVRDQIKRLQLLGYNNHTTNRQAENMKHAENGVKTSLKRTAAAS